MDGSCDGWMSKARALKSLVKRSPAARQKGPLSRNALPRAMVMNKPSLDMYVSYLTQNSPPPPQLMVARKQSHLTDYFGSQQDKAKSKVRNTPARDKEMDIAPICCDTEDGHGEEPFQMIAPNGSQLLAETNISQSQYHGDSNDPLLTLSSSHIPDEKHHGRLDCVEHRQLQSLAKASDSVVPRSDEFGQVIDCICNKENCLQGCGSECSHSEAHNTKPTLSDESKRVQECVCQGVSEEYSSKVDNFEGYITFSEGMELLSQQLMSNDIITELHGNHEDHLSLKEDDCLCSPKHEQFSVSANSERISASNHERISTPSHRRLLVSSNHERISACDHEMLSDSQNFQCFSSIACEQVLCPVTKVQGTIDMQFSYNDSGDAVEVTCNSFADRHNISSFPAVKKCKKSSKCVVEDTEIRMSEFSSVKDDIKWRLSYSSDNDISSKAPLLRNAALFDFESANLTEMSLTVSTADSITSSDIDISGDSQLSVLRGEQLQKKKKQYMSDIGTLVLSEDI